MSFAIQGTYRSNPPEYPKDIQEYAANKCQKQDSNMPVNGPVDFTNTIDDSISRKCSFSCQLQIFPSGNKI